MPFKRAFRWPKPLRSGNWTFTVFGITLLLAFLGATGIVQNGERQTAETQAVVHSATLARATEEHTVATIRAIDQTLQNIAHDFRRDPERFDFDYWVRSTASTFGPNTGILSIFDANGLVVSNSRSIKDLFIGDRNHFIQQRDSTGCGVLVSPPIMLRTINRTMIPFSYRLEKADGSFAGIVTFLLDVAYFEDFYRTILVGRQGAITLIGLDRVLRAGILGAESAVGRTVHGTRLFKELETEPVGSYRMVTTGDGVDRIVSYRRLPQYPLAVTVAFSTEEMLGPYRQFRDEIRFGALLITAISLAIMILLIAQIGRRRDSEMLLKSVVDAAPATIQLKGADLRIRWTNLAFRAFFSPLQAEPIGKRTREVTEDDLYQASAEDHDHEVITTGCSLTNLAQHFPATATHPARSLLVSKTPIFGADGKVSQILTIGTDVTALRKAEADAAASRQAELAAEVARAEVGRLLSNMPTVVYCATVDENDGLTLSFVSDNMTEITGRTVDSISDPNGWYATLSPESAPDIETFLATLREHGEAQTEYQLPDQGAPRIRDRARVVARFDNKIEIIGNWTDITREHAIAQRAIASAKLATLGELAAGLAHELSQPIAVMSLAAENAEDALRDGAAGIEAARIRLHRIVEHAQRAKRVVAHLRSVGRDDTGPLEPVSLHDAVAGALVLVRKDFDDDSIAVESKLPADLPMASGRTVLIENVLVNIFVNARDAMRDVAVEQRKLRIEGTSLPDGQVELRVTDWGGGIPPEVMPHVFEPFYSTKSPGQGAGLGLSISRDMMQAMNGVLSATNVESGACFTLTLRIAA